MDSLRFINNIINDDSRGTLTAIEAYKETGIVYKRFFLIMLKGALEEVMHTNIHTK
tara:strand:- start:56 stop:223 length:168 start_codon:yes stop_codon:yes gene_type:complete